jgi:lycopene cyclase domain-containing protein
VQVYLTLTIIVFVVIVALSFTGKVPFYKEVKYFLPAILIPSLLFLPWNYFFSAWKVWYFSEGALMGPTAIGFPVEDQLFLFTLPLLTLFIHHMVKTRMPEVRKRAWPVFVTSLLLLLTLVLAVMFRKLLYTATVSLFCAFLLAFRLWVIPRKPMGAFYVSFAICVVPVFLIYVVLCNMQVLNYDSSLTLGINLLGVPTENLLYYLSMALMNIGLYDGLRNRSKKKMEVREMTEEPLPA